MTERKLVTIRTIGSISPIEGADRIEMITVDGWELVAVKGEFKPGDPCVYFEIDSFLPMEERYEFLRKSCYKKIMTTGQEGFRIKTMRMRGQISQGLALPFSKCPECSPLEIGTDVTDLMKVIKYEIPCSAVLSGDARSLFPSYCPKTDEERIQNVYFKYKELYGDLDDDVEITVKLDGSSMTCMVDPETDEFLVCSRNLSLKETEGNTYWKIARIDHLEEIIRCANDHFGVHHALSGELMGPGIQKNREKLASHGFYVFNVFNITSKRYLTPSERAAFVEFVETTGMNFRCVPFVGHISCRELFSKTLKEILGMANGKSLCADTREGVVFKSSRFSFKAISNEYLLKEEA